ncbi:hypothetical protein KZ483_10060 [Paenibacillus sp. sptzw28]|uniref:glycosyl hydrolase family 28 protein n=1 Tax=Paenibacillus sp. sptzw28 TaxID=715179 RepID=UPI001C6E3A2E|nr:glycosyl hydrolase family 28 protein [Paenibacillus sp. sptzw28]QYR23224.1 hypothetical protein KZ483_10060 [Paenibacillus sp. sptzw28]
MTVKIYDAPSGAVGSGDFSVRVRPVGGQWKDLFIYKVKVDMHNVREASMAAFDMDENVEVEIMCGLNVENAVIRPLSFEIMPVVKGTTVSFTLDRPRKLAIEINGERFHNLHLFANPIEESPPTPEDPNVLVLKPAIHRTEDILRLAASPLTPGGGIPDVLYFAPGMHYLEETVLRIPSGKTVYIAGGAVVVGSLVCENVHDVNIRGRGILYLSDFHRFSAFRGVRIVFSTGISVEGITTIDPPHYSIYLGKSQNVRIRNFKSFSTRGWSDGIDMMACSDIEIDDVFLRTSDDSIAIYGTRWDFVGDARNITVKNSVFWADVAHALMIGTHGDYHKDGDVIENIRFENIDILEHHEPQPNYWGAMAINAGDKNIVRNVTYDNIRVEAFELGQLLDVRVVWNKDYNPAPGKRVENVRFHNIDYNGANTNPSRIHGYDADHIVDGVTFVNLRINGQQILDAESGNLDINSFTEDISFRLE